MFSHLVSSREQTSSVKGRTVFFKIQIRNHIQRSPLPQVESRRGVKETNIHLEGRILEGREDILCDSTMMHMWHYAPARTYAVATRSEPTCRFWNLGDVSGRFTSSNWF